MQDFLRNFIFTAALAVLLVSGASAEGLPPGAAAEGNLALGDFGTNDLLSIDTDPAGATLSLIRGATLGTADSIKISSDNKWKLEVADAGGTNTDSPGKMEEYQSGAYVASGADLTSKLEILVEGIGGNGALSGVTLTDVEETNDLSDTSTYRTFAQSDNTASGLTVDLEYSQSVASNDPLKTYRIDLTYKLSYNT